MGFKDDIIKFIKNVKYDHIFGTRETESRFGSDTIYNVEDAFEYLNRIVNEQNDSEIYSSFEKIGDLHIYTDGRPVEFLAANKSELSASLYQETPLITPEFVDVPLTSPVINIEQSSKLEKDYTNISKKIPYGDV